MNCFVVVRALPQEADPIPVKFLDAMVRVYDLAGKTIEFLKEFSAAFFGLGRSTQDSMICINASLDFVEEVQIAFLAMVSRMCVLLTLRDIH